MHLDGLLKDLEAKLQILEYMRGKGEDILSKGNTTTIERHRDGLVALAKQADEINIKVEQEKLAKGEALEEVCTWGCGIDKRIESVDTAIEHLGKCLREAKMQSQLTEKENEGALAAKEMEQQLEFERQKLEMKLEYERKSEELKKEKSGDSGNAQAKLPKLSITKFDGSFENWLSFWNKFTAEIDSKDLPSITKFAYLKELIDTKVRADIEGLPFKSEGYERAKNILKSEYGKTSEIVNAYVRNIMGLPTIVTTQTKDIDELYKKLLFNVQRLETLGKLREVSRNVRAVLDKLKGIKADLVRGEEGWRDWDFGQLLQAIKRWRDINCDLQVSIDGSRSKGKMIGTMGIHVGDPSTHVKGTENRCVVECTAIKKITCLLIAPKS